MKYLLGIDFGGGASKATLIDVEGKIIAENTVEYPTYYPTNTSLKDEKKIGSSDQLTIIMTYSGDLNYTIVEEYVLKSEKEVIDYVDGYIYVMGDSIAIINNNVLTFFAEGISYTLASNQVAVDELVKIGNSLIVSYEK